MIIKLTNASKDFEGDPLLINAKHILSVFGVEEVKEVDGMKVITSVASIYTITQQSWVVQESIDEIYDLIKKETDYD